MRGKYYYAWSRGFYRVFSFATRCPIDCKKYFDREEAREAVYALNGWPYKGKIKEGGSRC